MSNAVQIVGEKSRSDGRESIPDRVQRLQHERREIAKRKQDIECQLAELESVRLNEQAQLRKRRIDHHAMVTESSNIQARYSGEKARLIRELNNVVEELAINGQSVGSVHGNYPHPSDTILLRIEGVLLRILEKMNSN